MDLHKQFVQLGNQRNKLTYKLLQLLPEIYRQEIYKKYCTTIEEYAGKFAGLSNGVVQKRLKLEKHLKDKPHLKEAISTQGIHKVALMAKLATPETDKTMAEKVENMSKPSLVTLSKELRNKWEISNKDIEKAAKAEAVKEKIKIELDGEMLFMFLKLKKKIKSLSNKEAMKQILEKLYKREFKNKIKRQESKKSKNFPGKKVDNRYILVDQKREAVSKTNEKCAYENCNRPYEVLHHCTRFFEEKNHDSIIPLCKEHHEFMHNGLISNEQDKPSNWKISVTAPIKHEADQLYRKYRQEALL